MQFVAFCTAFLVVSGQFMHFTDDPLVLWDDITACGEASIETGEDFVEQDHPFPYRLSCGCMPKEQALIKGIILPEWLPKRKGI